VLAGGAGGKRRPQAGVVGVLALAHPAPRRAGLRQLLRRAGAVPRQGATGLRAVFSREPVALPDAACAAAGGSDGSLNCHGYGSSVTVTATFGFVAAAEVLRLLMPSDTAAAARNRERAVL
ncbi:MAG: tRNA threonylcarbamoyladenosine dehydratase, partial [Pseudomonadota bacterium]